MQEVERIEARVATDLRQLGLPYERIEIDPDFADTADFCARYRVPVENSANTIVVASKGSPKQFCACVIAADRKLDVNRCVTGLMGVSRASFARAEETAELTGMMIGGVTAIGLPPGLPVYVDVRLMTLDYVVLGGGSRSSKIRIAPEVFERLPEAQMIPDLSIPRG